MKSFRQWIFEDGMHSLIPPNIPRTQTNLIGNELRTSSGQSSRKRCGESENRYNQFKNKIAELPVPRFSKRQKGLGNLGMEIIRNTTF